ncbi:MAG: hypothetical protein ACRD9W_02675 [Terriglobia bacterium]
MLLYFVGQGAKRVAWPVFAGTARLIIATAGGWLAIRVFHAELPLLFAVVAVSAVAFGGLIALTTHLQTWGASDSGDRLQEGSSVHGQPRLA